MRRKSAYALAVERIQNKDGDRQIEKREYGCGMEKQPARARVESSVVHEKLHFFSSRSEKNSKLTTSSSGARKSPRLNTKANVAPATTPGIDSGKITFQKVCPGVAPRS